MNFYQSAMCNPVTPNLFVHIVLCGDKPRKINAGIVIILLPPVKAPNEPAIRPTAKIINRLVISITNPHIYDYREIWRSESTVGCNV